MSLPDTSLVGRRADDLASGLAPVRGPVVELAAWPFPGPLLLLSLVAGGDPVPVCSLLGTAVTLEFTDAQELPSEFSFLSLRSFQEEHGSDARLLASELCGSTSPTARGVGAEPLFSLLDWPLVLPPLAVVLAQVACDSCCELEYVCDGRADKEKRSF